jgi:hypothetical protein
MRAEQEQNRARVVGPVRVDEDMRREFSATPAISPT